MGWTGREGRGWYWSAGNVEPRSGERLGMERLREAGNRKVKRGEAGNGEARRERLGMERPRGERLGNGNGESKREEA